VVPWLGADTRADALPAVPVHQFFAPRKVGVWHAPALAFLVNVELRDTRGRAQVAHDRQKRLRGTIGLRLADVDRRLEDHLEQLARVKALREALADEASHLVDLARANALADGNQQPRAFIELAAALEPAAVGRPQLEVVRVDRRRPGIRVSHGAA
jgi:hypothetical protein